MYSNPQGLFNLSVPEKQYRMQNYQNVSYLSYRINQLKQKSQETGVQYSTDDIPYRQWSQDSATAATVLKVMARSKAPRMIRVSIKLSVADNPAKNVNLPTTELKVDLFSNDNKMAFLFLKIDPTMASWGDLECEVNVKMGKTSQISSGGGYNSGGWYSTSVGTSMSTIPLGQGTGMQYS